MTNYRKMRRQAGLARRSGLQPMMVINTGDALPETAGVLLARWAWRYRSELAPLAVTAALAPRGIGRNDQRRYLPRDMQLDRAVDARIQGAVGIRHVDFRE